MSVENSECEMRRREVLSTIRADIKNERAFIFDRHSQLEKSQDEIKDWALRLENKIDQLKWYLLMLVIAIILGTVGLKAV